MNVPSFEIPQGSGITPEDATAAHLIYTMGLTVLAHYGRDIVSPSGEPALTYTSIDTAVVAAAKNLRPSEVAKPGEALALFHRAADGPVRGTADARLLVRSNNLLQFEEPDMKPARLVCDLLFDVPADPARPAIWHGLEADIHTLDGEPYPEAQAYVLDGMPESIRLGHIVNMEYTLGIVRDSVLPLLESRR